MLMQRYRIEISSFYNRFADERFYRISEEKVRVLFGTVAVAAH